MKTETRTKNIYDNKHVKAVRAVALLKDGKEAGKIIASFSDNPAGSVCTAQVFLYGDEWQEKIRKHDIKTLLHVFQTTVPMIGKAGGYGYDKLSSAIYSALRVGGIEKLIKVEPASGNHREAFEKAGFHWFEVC